MMMAFYGSAETVSVASRLRPLLSVLAGECLEKTPNSLTVPLPGEQFAWAHRAVVLVDIVESVRLVDQDEVNVISRWLALVKHVRTTLLPEHGGRLVKSLGDGMLLDFEDVRSAVSAALSIQQASNVDNAGHPPERHILLRIGIEVSDVIVELDDVHGRGVNLAARLMTLAGPGEIV